MKYAVPVPLSLALSAARVIGFALASAVYVNQSLYQTKSVLTKVCCSNVYKR